MTWRAVGFTSHVTYSGLTIKTDASRLIDCTMIYRDVQSTGTPMALFRRSTVPRARYVAAHWPRPHYSRVRRRAHTLQSGRWRTRRADCPFTWRAALWGGRCWATWAARWAGPGLWTRSAGRARRERARRRTSRCSSSSPSDHNTERGQVFNF